MFVLHYLELAAGGSLSPPSGFMGWLPYIGGLVVAYVALRRMPGDNAASVGATLGGLNDRLQAETKRLDAVIVALRGEIAAEEEAHELTRAALASMRAERDDLLRELDDRTA